MQDAVRCYQDAFDANVAKKQVEIMNQSGTTTVALYIRNMNTAEQSPSREPTVELAAAATFSIFGFSKANHDKYHSNFGDYPAAPHPVTELIGKH